ncbi:MAG: hypothetical protein LBG74_04810 [Spirochaetaceae bacterium]|jgi:hypothetical protein|nr:hypothetical protein [Spirochaetaceae bacterium]
MKTTVFNKQVLVCAFAVIFAVSCGKGITDAPRGPEDGIGDGVLLNAGDVSLSYEKMLLYANSAEMKPLELSLSDEAAKNASITWNAVPKR